MAKGSSYERDVCKQLSLWFSCGTRDDLFWRSSNSGGRATMRAKRGKRTMQGHGDIAATDPMGAPLLELLTIELKRGYSSHSFADLLDTLPHRKPRLVAQFIAQAMRSAHEAGTPGWMLVHRRDQKAAMAFVSSNVCAALRAQGALNALQAGFLRGRVRLNGDSVAFAVFQLADFLASVPPGAVRKALAQLKSP